MNVGDLSAKLLLEEDPLGFAPEGLTHENDTKRDLTDMSHALNKVVRIV
jgi:hypothetical protein